MKKPIGIPKAAPDTTLEAFGRIQDLCDAVNALRVAAMSETHSLNLSVTALGQLLVAHQALKAAHRAVEATLTVHPS